MAQSDGRSRPNHLAADDGERISRLETTVETFGEALASLVKRVDRGFDAITQRFEKQEALQTQEKAGVRDSWWKAASVSIAVLGLLLTTGLAVLGFVITTLGKSYIDPIRSEVAAQKHQIETSREDHKETIAVLRDAVERIAERTDELSRTMVSVAKSLELNLIEVETQFRCADSLSLHRAANDYQMHALLWGKVFPDTPLPLPYAPPVGVARVRPHPE